MIIFECYRCLAETTDHANTEGTHHQLLARSYPIFRVYYDSLGHSGTADTRRNCTSRREPATGQRRRLFAHRSCQARVAIAAIMRSCYCNEITVRII